MNREFHFWTIDKYKQEEAWLNDLARQGKALVKQDFGIRYTFEDSEKGEWQYKILFNEDLPGTCGRENFEAFLAENGIEQVGKWFLWGYYRKRNDGTPFELFNTRAEEFRQMSRVLQLATVLKAVMLFDMLLSLCRLAGAGLDKLPLVLFVGAVFIFVLNTQRNIKKQVELLKKEADIFE